MALWTEIDVLRLKTAIASGVLSVTYDGPPRRTITYHSMDSMRELLAEMIRDVAVQQNVAAPSFRRVSWNKGFDRPARRSWRRNE